MRLREEIGQIEPVDPIEHGFACSSLAFYGNPDDLIDLTIDLFLAARIIHCRDAAQVLFPLLDEMIGEAHSAVIAIWTGQGQESAFAEGTGARVESSGLLGHHGGAAIFAFH